MAEGVAEEDLAYAPSTGARRVHEIEVCEGTAANLEGLARLVEDPDAFAIEIVRWPAKGWRPIDAGSGDQGGVTEGRFELAWRGETLFARNHAVGDGYLFGWSAWPKGARVEGPAATRKRFFAWRANYHPDGGQLVWPERKGAAFWTLLAPPGDDVRPESFVAFRLDGRSGLYIPPDVWHGPFAPEDESAVLHDRQGRVHARVSVDFPKEFGCYVGFPLASARRCLPGGVLP